MSKRSRASGAMVSYAEVKSYLSQREIPQLFESLMAGLMYHRPENHIGYLQNCLDEVRSGSETRVQWSTFVNARKRKSKEILPPLTPKKQDSFSSWSDNSRQSTPLPPISAKTSPESKNTYILYHNPPPVLAKPQVPVLFMLGGPGTKTDELCEQVVARLRGLVHISICSMLKTRMTIEGFHRLTSVPACAVVDSVLQAMSMVKSAGALLVAGFPRNRGDIEEYRSRGVRMDGVVLVDFEEEALRRYLKHEIANAADVELELERYKKDIISVAEYYDNKDLLTVVMGDQDMEDIVEDLVLSVDRVIETRKRTGGFWDDDEGEDHSRGRSSTVEIRDATEEDVASMQAESAAPSLGGKEMPNGASKNELEIAQESTIEKSCTEHERDEKNRKCEMEYATLTEYPEEGELKEIDKMERISTITGGTDIRKSAETEDVKQEITTDGALPIQRIPLLCALENLNLIDEEKIRNLIANELGMCFIDYYQLALDDKVLDLVEGFRLLQKVLKQDEVSYSKGFFIYRFPFELLNVRDIDQILKLGYVSFISNEKKDEGQEWQLFLQSTVRDKVGLILTTESKLEDELRRFIREFQCTSYNISRQEQESTYSLELFKKANNLEKFKYTNDGNRNVNDEISNTSIDEKDRNNFDKENELLNYGSVKHSTHSEDLCFEESGKESFKESIINNMKDEIRFDVIDNQSHETYEMPNGTTLSSEELRNEAEQNAEIQLDEESEKSEKEEENVSKEESKVDNEDTIDVEISPTVINDDQHTRADKLVDENKKSQIYYTGIEQKSMSSTERNVPEQEKGENDNHSSFSPKNNQSTNSEIGIDEGLQKSRKEQTSIEIKEISRENQEQNKENKTLSHSEQNFFSNEEEDLTPLVENEVSENQRNETPSPENDDQQSNGKNAKCELSASNNTESKPEMQEDFVASEHESDLIHSLANESSIVEEKAEDALEDAEVTTNEGEEVTEFITDDQQPSMCLVESSISGQENPIKDITILSSISDESDGGRKLEILKNSKQHTKESKDQFSENNEQFRTVPVVESELPEQACHQIEGERTPSPKNDNSDMIGKSEMVVGDHDESVKKGDQSHEPNTEVSSTYVIKSKILEELDSIGKHLSDSFSENGNASENENEVVEIKMQNFVEDGNGNLHTEREQYLEVSEEDASSYIVGDEISEQELDSFGKLTNSSNKSLDAEENTKDVEENNEDYIYKDNSEKSHELEAVDKSEEKCQELEGQDDSRRKGDELEGQEESEEKIHELEGQDESEEKIHELEGQDESEEKIHELEGQDESEEKCHEGQYELGEKCHEVVEQDESGEKCHEFEEQVESKKQSHELVGQDELGEKSQELEGQDESERNCHEFEGGNESISVVEGPFLDLKENGETAAECRSPSPTENYLDAKENEVVVKENLQNQEEEQNLNEKLPSPVAESEVSETEIETGTEQTESDETLPIENERQDAHDKMEGNAIKEGNSQLEGQSAKVVGDTTQSEERNKQLEELEKVQSGSVDNGSVSTMIPNQLVKCRDEEEHFDRSDSSLEESAIIENEEEAEESQRMWKESDDGPKDTFSAKRRSGSGRRKTTDEDAEAQERSSSSSRGEM